MTKRLFVGLEIPESSRATLAELDTGIAGMRWLPPSNYHLTLSFLGQVNQEHEDDLRDALADVKVSPFFLPIIGLDTFGGAKPSVLWAGVGTAHPHLFALHKQVQDAVLRAGLEPELKSFHPHITVARARDLKRAALEPFLRRHKETEFGLWRVNGLTLFSSRVSPEGSSYTAELRKPLG